MTEAIRPNPGPQTTFLSSPADIAIFGGAAGGGKSVGLLLEPLRHVRLRAFRGVIFRRELRQVKKAGGLWDASSEIYPAARASPRLVDLEWQFPAGSRIAFGHLEHESDKLTWQGAEIAYLAFDELTHFTATQFWYLLSRNRSTCGIRPYVRATTNPEAGTWVAELLAWWWDPATGYPIPERSGVVRWFVRRHGTLIWADSREDLLRQMPDCRPKSLTFIAASLADNPQLEERDPDYRANLEALDYVERERLLHGNWLVRHAAGQVFRRSWFEIVDAAPARLQRIRWWDLAATSLAEGGDPAFTAGVRLGVDPEGVYWLEHVERFLGSPLAVREAMVRLGRQDGLDCTIGFPQDPGQAGKDQKQGLVRMLAGFRLAYWRETGDKATRASSASAQAEAGNIKIVRGPWNEAFLQEAEAFDGKTGKSDQIDALANALNYLAGHRGGGGFVGGRVTR